MNTSMMDCKWVVLLKKFIERWLVVLAVLKAAILKTLSWRNEDVFSYKINPFCNDYSQSDVLQNLCSKLKTMTDHITGNQEKNRNYCCRINSTFLLYIILKGILDIYIATIGYMLLYRKMLIFA